MSKITVGISSRKDFFEKLRGDARKLDLGKSLPAERSIHFEDPVDMFKLLTPSRVKLLRAVRERPAHITALARILERTPSAVRRDVAALEAAHLIRRRTAINPGHGRTSVVAAVAHRLSLTASV